MQEPDLSKFQPLNHDTTGVTSGAVVTLPVAKASRAFLAEVICEDNSIRYWKDESDFPPDSIRGILMGAGERVYLWTVEIAYFRCIATGASARIQTTFYIRRVGLRAVEHA